ncbi:conserved hypothetical protein [Leishmania major strain Friedlin]|uniref:Uncharacterized protein n=1 Tax=Leishmania major TaxID=5664 RepID=Q4QFB9_LEIMA|nr:conserved hypothetical protein [Leishmania major strain Friedlin]CAG9571418.1 hypothetical_protein_-_conserved [Leishmania major strain Friedlin]CAJ03290.1 conserved hypothetical protein [Leishmania major strain Friedlin]|eukprot:XP_001681979.1 conserved hypothetical protein [Leishmania major strain Friedlin]
MTSGAGIDGGVSGMAGGGRGMGSMLNTKAAASGMDINSPNSYSMVQAQGMMGMMPYMMSGGGASGTGGGGHGVMGSGRMGTGSPNSFLPPPGEDTDQQELLRLQQTNYRVKMLPPPLTYEVHRKMWSRNEYGDEDDNDEDDVHGHGHGGAGGNVDQEHESSGGGSIANEDPIDKEQRLEAYKQIMLRWYSHIHVLEGKPEVAKRLVRVRRACPSMEEVVYSLTHPQQPGAVLEMETGGNDESTPTAVPPPLTAAAAAARRSSDGMPDMEEILATWSSRCWNWWQETVKRKPRRARKQGELPIAGGNGASGTSMTTSALPLAGMTNGSVMPRNPSSRNMDMGDSAVPPPPPHLTGGGGGPYTHPSTYANHDGSGTAGGMPVVSSYKSFTDLSEEGMDGPAATSGSLSHYSHHHNDGGSFAPSQTRPSHPALPHDASPMAAMFTVNGPRTAALRGTSEDFLENDHLTLAFTTELLKSLEE